MLEVTQTELAEVQRQVQKARLPGAKDIGLRVGKAINRHRVGKRFDLDIQDDRFAFVINDTQMAAEARLDGIYIVRTSLSSELMAAVEVVRSYKRPMTANTCT